MEIEFQDADGSNVFTLAGYNGDCLFDTIGMFCDKFLNLTSRVDTKTYDHAPSQNGRYIKSFGLESYGSWEIQFYIVQSDFASVTYAFDYVVCQGLCQIAPFQMIVDSGNPYQGCVFLGDKTKMESPHMIGNGNWIAKVQMIIVQEQAQ